MWVKIHSYGHSGKTPGNYGTGGQSGQSAMSKQHLSLFTRKATFRRILEAFTSCELLCEAVTEQLKLGGGRQELIIIAQPVCRLFANRRDNCADCHVRPGLINIYTSSTKMSRGRFSVSKVFSCNVYRILSCTNVFDLFFRSFIAVL